MKRIHIAIGVSHIARSVKDYSRRLGSKPVVVVPNEYALWRTRHVNFSVRRVTKGAGSLRHLGWEDSSATRFSKRSDCNGIVWEKFNAAVQMKEIEDAWPRSSRTAERPKRSQNTTQRGRALVIR